MSEYTNESICSQCNGICEVIEMSETVHSEHFGQKRRDKPTWNASSCCEADVRAYDEELDDA